MDGPTRQHIRKTPQKTRSLIFDFTDIGKYTKKHSSKRRKMLKSEPEFVVREIDHFDYKEKMQYVDPF